MPISRGQMNRQLYRGGGIMSLSKEGIGGGDYKGIDMGSRVGYGLIKKIKSFARKIIPNEVADIAVKAAPFVAPFNPALGGAMAGLGSFDQTGSISRGVKSGLLNYGLGQGARYLGGAGVQGNPFSSGGAFTKSGFTSGFSSPMGSGGIKNLFNKSTPIKDIPINASEVGGNINIGPSYDALGGEMMTTGAKDVVGTSIEQSVPSTFKQSVSKITSGDFTQMGEGLKELGGQGLKSVFTKPIPGSPGETQIDKLAIGATIAGGVSYLDAKKLAKEAELVGDADEYTEEMYEADKARYSEYYADIITPAAFGLKEGGRVKYQSGAFGVPSITLDEKEENELDVEALNETLRKYPNAVNELTDFEPGIFGPNEPTDQGPYPMDDKTQEEKEAEMLYELEQELNSKADGDPDFLGIKNLKASEAMEGRSSFTLDDLKDEGFEIDPDTVLVMIEGPNGIKLKEVLKSEALKDNLKIVSDTGEFPEGRKAGGRIGFFEGNDDPSDPRFSPQKRKGIISINPMQDDTDELLTGGGGIGGILSPFTRAEKSFLFKTLAKQGGSDRTFTMPNLYKIFKNPGKFKKDEAALKAFLKIKMGKKEGGRAELAMGSEVPVRKNRGGITELDYRNTGGFVPVGIKEKADDVPAMLSKNEFVMTADAVRGIGNGDVETGAQKLYNIMKQAEKQGIA